MKIAVIGEGIELKNQIAVPSSFGQDTRLSDLATSTSLLGQTIFEGKPLNCKICGSTHTLRKTDDGYICEFHFKELRRTQNENR